MRVQPEDERLKRSVQGIGQLRQRPSDPHPEFAYDRLSRIVQDAADQGLIIPCDLSLEMPRIEGTHIVDQQNRRASEINSIERPRHSPRWIAGQMLLLSIRSNWPCRIIVYEIVTLACEDLHVFPCNPASTVKHLVNDSHWSARFGQARLDLSWRVSL
jgi:hypothetical protein